MTHLFKELEEALVILGHKTGRETLNPQELSIQDRKRQTKNIGTILKKIPCCRIRSLDC